MAAVRRNAAQNCSLYVVEGRIPPRQVAVRLSAVERERIRRATETNGCKATGRLEVAATRARSRPSLTEVEKAGQRLASASLAASSRDPVTKADKANIQLAAGARRSKHRAFMTEEKKAQI